MLYVYAFSNLKNVLGLNKLSTCESENWEITAKLTPTIDNVDTIFLNYWYIYIYRISSFIVFFYKTIYTWLSSIVPLEL